MICGCVECDALNKGKVEFSIEQIKLSRRCEICSGDIFNYHNPLEFDFTPLMCAGCKKYLLYHYDKSIIDNLCQIPSRTNYFVGDKVLEKFVWDDNRSICIFKLEDYLHVYHYNIDSYCIEADWFEFDSPEKAIEKILKFQCFK